MVAVSRDTCHPTVVVDAAVEHSTHTRLPSFLVRATRVSAPLVESTETEPGWNVVECCDSSMLTTLSKDKHWPIFDMLSLCVTLLLGTDPLGARRQTSNNTYRHK